MPGFLRSFLGDRGPRRDRPAVALRDVSHRVFVERPPAEVWRALVAPAPDAERGVDCVHVLALPVSPASGLPEFAAVWRRPNGRAWTGLATVVAIEHGSRVVSRSADGAWPLTLTTTLEPLDHGTVVAQVLDGVAPGEPAAGFARGWIARALLGLKADVEGRPREPRGPADPLGADDAPALPGPSEAVPVSESASVEVGLAPGVLWDFLMAPESEAVVRPTVERVVRVRLSDEPDHEHVLAVHRHDDGRRAVGVSAVVEATEPARIVERDLTSTHESDVVTTIEPSVAGSLLTETLTAWLPGGPGRVIDPAPLVAAMRSRLAAIKVLAEAGVQAPRDPRTGFLPPGAPAPAMPEQTDAGHPAGGPSVPSSVLLPPPHVVAPARPYTPDHAWWTWHDLGFYASTDLAWW